MSLLEPELEPETVSYSDSPEVDSVVCWLVEELVSSSASNPLNDGLIHTGQDEVVATSLFF